MHNMIKNYNCIDLTKFIMAILVVVAHSAPLSDISEVWNFYVADAIARIAVPFFFVASGFFLFKKIDLKNLDDKIVKNYCYGIMSLYLTWTVIYFPISLYHIYKADDGLCAILEYVLNFFLRGSYFHFWYLPASVVAVLVIWYLLKKKFSLQTITLIGFLFFIIAMLARGYYGFYLMMFPEGTFVNDVMLAIGKVIPPINGLTKGLIFIALGAMVAKEYFDYSKKTVIIGCLISLIVWNIENMFLYEFNIWHVASNASLTLIPATLFTFLLTTKIKLRNWAGWVILRKMSLYIYLIHPIFLLLVKFLYNKVFMIPTNHLAIFAIALVIIMIVSYGCVMYKSKKVCD